MARRVIFTRFGKVRIGHTVVGTVTRPDPSGRHLRRQWCFLPNAGWGQGAAWAPTRAGLTDAILAEHLRLTAPGREWFAAQLKALGVEP